MKVHTARLRRNFGAFFVYAYSKNRISRIVIFCHRQNFILEPSCLSIDNFVIFNLNGGKGETMFEYWRWKREAKKALTEKKTAECHICKEPIFPGDFVGRAVSGEGRKVLVHAGFHFSLTERSSFCETGAIGTGAWNGTEVVDEGESALAKAIRTGDVQIR